MYIEAITSEISQHREMAIWEIETKAASIRATCASFAISMTCHHYIRKLDSEKAQITNSLVQLMEIHHNCGFSDLHLCSKKYCTHKCVYRIYCDIKLNLWIKPKIPDLCF